MTDAPINLPDRAAFDDQGFARLSGPGITALKADLNRVMLDTARRAAMRLLPQALSNTAPDTDSLDDYLAWLLSVERDNGVTRALYEVFPALPPVIATINHPVLRTAIAWAGLDAPSAGTLPLVRLDRPGQSQFATPAHQDSWYSMLSDNAVTLWLPLCNMTADMGRLEIVPGSHSAGIAAFKPYEAGHEWFETERPVDDADFEAIDMADDEILIFNQSLIHRSGANGSNRVRISVQFRYNDLANAKRLTSTYTPSLSRYVLDQQARHLDDRKRYQHPAA